MNTRLNMFCTSGAFLIIVCFMLASATFADEYFSERETKLNNYISVSMREGEFFDAANGLIELGNLYEDNGSSDKAFASYKKAYDYAVRELEDGGDDPELSDIASTAAGLAAASLNSVGYRDDALRWFGFAEKYALALNDEGCIARIHNNRGAVYDSMGDYRDALRDYFSALEKSSGDSKSTCDKLLTASSALNNIGLLYLAQGNTTKAADFLGRALDIDVKSGDARRQAITKNNLCLTAAAKGEYSITAECYTAAAALFDSAADASGAALARINNADAMLLLGNATGAADELSKLLNAAPPLPANLRAAALHNLASSELRLKQPAPALKHIEEAVSLKEDSANLDYASLALKGEILHALGRRDDAKSAFGAAIERIEKRRGFAAGSKDEQARAFSQMAHVYREMILLLLESDDVEGALRYYELMKARTLKEIIDGGPPPWNKMLTPDEALRKKELETRIASFNRRAGIAASLLASAAEPSAQRNARADLLETKKQNDEAVTEYNLFMDAVFSKHPELAAKTGNYKPSALKDIRSSLSPDEIAVCFLPSDDSLTIFMITAGSVKFKRVDFEKNALRKSYEVIERWKKNPEITATFDSGIVKLSALLLEPVAGDLAQFNKVIVIPDSYLWEVPFQALMSAGKALVETHEIEYALSLEGLRGRGARDGDADFVTAFGDAVYLGECPGGKCARGGEAFESNGVTEWQRGDLSRFGLLSRIPGTGEEVEGIKSIFPDGGMFLGQDASERNFMSNHGGTGILHLATHGIYNGRDPMGSAIALSQIGLAEGEDGFVQAREIFQLSIPARLVVLSACESARSESLEGEGVTGLVWSFISAGAGGVVASQWYVSDYSTALTMKKFYEGLKSGKPAPAALRDAQLFVLHYTDKDLSAPFYWAPFIYIGSAR